MKTSRVAVVRSVGTSDWRSCQVIGANLAKAYRAALGKRGKFFSCRNWRRPSDIAATARRIHRYAPKRIVFLDHAPYPGALIGALKALYGAAEFPELLFHVYGDFTRNSQVWLGSEALLRGTRTLFACASKEQCALVSKFVRRPKEQVFLVPFPVDPEDYFVDSDARSRWRRRLGIRPDEWVISYAGRVSTQKNALRCLAESLHFARRSGRAVRILVAGEFDDLGAPFFGIKPKPGTCRKEWMEWLRALPLKERRQIRHLGWLGPKELRSLYNASDVFVSLSLYHDEDFGMAPAEALFCGSVCVLTRWGGYRSFHRINRKACRMIPVTVSRKGLKLSSDGIQAALDWAGRQSAGSGSRKKRALPYAAALSVSAISRRLAEMDSRRISVFRGFTPLLRKHAEALKTPPVFPGGPGVSGLYEAIYRSYLRG